MEAITQNEVKLSADWGVDLKFYDYNYGTTRVDFQDLMVMISENRATTVEVSQEVGCKGSNKA